MSNSNVNIELTHEEAEYLGHAMTTAVHVARPMLDDYLQAFNADPADTDAFRTVVGATSHFNFLVYLKRKFDKALAPGEDSASSLDCDGC